MTESIIVAIVSGLLTLVGVIVANSKSQAVTETRLDELTREVREHNNFARRMPVLEERMDEMTRRFDAHERRCGGD